MSDGVVQPITGRQWIVLAVLSFTVLLISLDQTVLNVALPTLIDDLHPSSTALPWISDSYTLTNAVLLLLGGSLGDRYGHKKVLLFGLVVFGAGSLACALVHTTGAVITARAFMGLGAAFLMPATLSIITATFAGEHRARAIGIWAGVGGIGTAAGPLLGGWLLQHFWWGSVFLINVPVAVIGLVLGAITIRETQAGRGSRLDPVGTVLSSVGLAAITYGLIVGPDDGWGSAKVLGCFAAGAVLLAAFGGWNVRRGPAALLDFSLFRNRTFSSALGAVTAVFLALFGASYLFSQYFQFVQGANSLGVGLRFLPLAIGSLVVSNVAARITARIGLRSIMVAGIFCVGAGMAVMALFIGPNGKLIPISVAFALLGVGIGLVIAPASTAIVGALPPAKVGIGSGLRSMVQLLGGSFGVAILGTVATSHYRAHVNHAFNGSLRAVPSGSRAPLADQIGQAVATASHLPRDLQATATSVATHAFTGGLRLTTAVGAGICLLALFAAARYIPARAQPPTAPSPSASNPAPAEVAGG